jgi:hypothetical protein
VGDLDGDTYPDFVIASPSWSPYLPPTDEGRIDVYSGQTFEVLWSFEGDSVETYVGWDVSGVGDVNGDGVRDVLCGTRYKVNPGSNNSEGYALILSGADGSVIRKHMAHAFNNREFGTPVAGLGDLNHDGHADYGIGDATYNVGSGSSWAFSGKDGSMLGTSLGGGSAISTAGDVDGNGTNDILVSHVRGNVNGLLSGTAQLRTCIWPDSACQVGTDTDGDGWNDDCDNCPYRNDKYQSDSDGDGNVCTRVDTLIMGAAVLVSNMFGAITFDNVTSDGSVSFEEVNTGPGTAGVFTPVPQDAPRFYNIETTAGYSGSIEICLRYDPTGLSAAEEADIRLFHYTGSAWAEITSSIDTSANNVCGISTSLSAFGLGLAVSVSVTDPDGANIPGAFGLQQSYPNPFNPSATIEFTLPEASHVTLRIYDVLGRPVTTLLDAVMSAGSNRVTWHGRNETGEAVPTGTYFYRLETAEGVVTKKMLLLK